MIFLFKKYFLTKIFAIVITLMPSVPCIKSAGINRYYAYNPTNTNIVMHVECKDWQPFTVEVKAHAVETIDLNVPLSVRETECLLKGFKNVK